jgi:hypothetical protein
MKKFILGFVLAALLFTALPVGAAVQQYILHAPDYKIYLGDKEYSDKDYPALTYKGKTYLPITALIDAFSLNLDLTVNKKIAISKPINEWVKVEDYNASFTDLPFIKSTSEGNIFSVKSATHTYNFKYEDGIWYVRLVD